MTKNAGTRTRTPSAGMEGALLASAADILESEGPDGLSVRRIAAAAGVAPMGVYNHFESKSGIIEALFIQGFERLGAAMQAMAQIARPIRGAARGRPPLPGPRPRPPDGVPGDVPAGRPGLRAERLRPRRVHRRLRTASSPPSSAPCRPASSPKAPPTETAQLIWATIHGWVSLELLGLGFVEDQDAGYDRLCEALLRGLRP